MNIGALDTLTIGAITLGTTDSNDVEWYWIDIDGWGAPASTVTVTQRAAGDGGFASPAYLGSRTYTVSLAVVAPTRALLVGALDSLNVEASIDPQPMTVITGGTTRTVSAQRQGEVASNESTPVSADVTIVFICVDPRKLGPAISATDTLNGAGSVTVGLHSDGKYTGPAVVTVAGPVTNPTVTHAGKATLTVALTKSIPAGKTVTFDMDNHLVIDSDGNDLAEYVTTRGWSGFDPGDNTWTVTATAATDADVTVVANPAWL